jgi:hypothetical protein
MGGTPRSARFYPQVSSGAPGVARGRAAAGYGERGGAAPPSAFAHHFIEEIVTAQFGDDPTHQGCDEIAEG